MASRNQRDELVSATANLYGCEGLQPHELAIDPLQETTGGNGGVGSRCTELAVFGIQIELGAPCCLVYRHYQAKTGSNRRCQPFQGCLAMQLTGLESAYMIDAISLTA